MTTIKLLSAGLIATVMLSTPAMACKNCVAKRHLAMKANARYIDGYARIPAPRVGPLATPPHGENCDVGDNPFIC